MLRATREPKMKDYRPASGGAMASVGRRIAVARPTSPRLEISLAAVPLASMSRPSTIAFLRKRLYPGAANERVFLVTRLNLGSI
jgi:hypothetical protein